MSSSLLKHTLRLTAQNLQSVLEGGSTWLTMSRFTGTPSFSRELFNRELSLMAMTCKSIWPGAERHDMWERWHAKPHVALTALNCEAIVKELTVGMVTITNSVVSLFLKISLTIIILSFSASSLSVWHPRTSREEFSEQPVWVLSVQHWS